MPEHMFDHRAYGMAKSSASLVGTGTPARRPPAPGQPASRRGRRRRPSLVLQAPALPATTGQEPGPASRPPPGGPGRLVVPYAELHCHSNASFLDGGSHPEELAEEAARLRLEALAITDHDGMYGIVRFAEAARALGLPTIFGAELTLTPDSSRPPGARAAGGADGDAGPGWGASGGAGPGAGGVRAVVPGDLGGADGRGEGGAPGGAGAAGGAAWRALGGADRVPEGGGAGALAERGPTAAQAELDLLVQAFGRDNVYVEIWDHGDPLDSVRNDALVRLADRARVEVVATNNVHYATPGRRRLATALAAVRARSSLADLDGWLPAGAGAHLRSGLEQATRLARYPGTVELAADLGRSLAFDLELVAPRLPDFPVPPGHTEMSWLRELAGQGATRRYGPRHAERTPGAWRQIDHELAMIEQLGFPGYFLIVWDIVRVLPPGRHLLPGPGLGGQLGRLLRHRDHQGRRRLPGPAVRAVPLPGARRAARHRPGHRGRPPRGGHPVRLRALRPRPGRPGGQRDHLPGPLGRARHGPGPRVRARPARRLVQAGRRLGADRGHRRARDPRAGHGAGPPGPALPAPPRDPLRRHGDLRPAGGRGLPGRVGDHEGPQRPPVGQGRLRRRRAGQVRPARPRDALGPARHRRPGSRPPRGRGRPGRAAPGGGRLRDAVRGRLGRGVPGREPGPDGHPAPAQRRGSSTTWWWRWP